MTDDWLKSMDDRRLVGAVMLDFSTAFDVIDHSLLLNKLKCYGFGSVAMALVLLLWLWFCCYVLDGELPD